MPPHPYRRRFQIASAQLALLKRAFADFPKFSLFRDPPFRCRYAILCKAKNFTKNWPENLVRDPPTRRVSILVFGSILKNWNKKFTLFELRLDKQSEFLIPIFGGTKFSGIKKVNSLYLFFFQTSTFGCKLENVWITYQFFSKNKTSSLRTSNKRNMQGGKVNRRR